MSLKSCGSNVSGFILMLNKMANKSWASEMACSSCLTNKLFYDRFSCGMYMYN